MLFNFVMISGSTHSFSPTGKPPETKLPPLSKRERERERERCNHEFLLFNVLPSFLLSFLARRNTLGHFPDKDKRPFSLSGRSYDDTTEPAQRPRYPETKADIERALKGGGKYPVFPPAYLPESGWATRFDFGLIG